MATLLRKAREYEFHTGEKGDVARGETAWASRQAEDREGPQMKDSGNGQQHRGQV